ncbi:MAG: hypothetical protein Q4C69_14115, partial [Lachnoclostridium edouardi]|nr:hypothetical protein [Lachnoclostridium edouardi]
MDRWILTADKALCGRELDLIENVSIIVEDGVIKEIISGQARNNIHIADAKEINLGDKTLMPGLIECHNHVTLDARLPEHLEMLSTSSESKLTALAINALKDDL